MDGASYGWVIRLDLGALNTSAMAFGKKCWALTNPLNTPLLPLVGWDGKVLMQLLAHEDDCQMVTGNEWEEYTSLPGVTADGLVSTYNLTIKRGGSSPMHLHPGGNQANQSWCGQRICHQRMVGAAVL